MMYITTMNLRKREYEIQNPQPELLALSGVYPTEDAHLATKAYVDNQVQAEPIPIVPQHMLKPSRQHRRGTADNPRGPFYAG